MKHRLLYNQRSRSLVVRRKMAALRHAAYTSIQPEESPPGGQERECSFNTWEIDFYTTSCQERLRHKLMSTMGINQERSRLYRLLYDKRTRPLVVSRENAALRCICIAFAFQSRRSPGCTNRCVAPVALCSSCCQYAYWKPQYVELIYFALK